MMLTLLMVAGFFLLTVCVADWFHTDDKEGKGNDNEDTDNDSE